MEKIKIKLFSSYFWQGKSMRTRKFGSVTFYLLPSIRFTDARMPVAIDGVKGTHHCFIIVFEWLFLAVTVLLASFTCKDKEQDDNTDAGNPGTIIFHEEES